MTDALLIQKLTAEDGKPGQSRKSGVVKFKLQDGHLLGLDTKGRIILVTNMADVSLATIEETHD